jgi:regulatory protein YycH of two-component signal transduction system YycFG
MSGYPIEIILAGLLIIDMVLTAYGIWAFKSAQKTCRMMLEKLVANHTKPRDEV